MPSPSTGVDRAALSDVLVRYAGARGLSDVAAWRGLIEREPNIGPTVAAVLADSGVEPPEVAVRARERLVRLQDVLTGLRDEALALAPSGYEVKGSTVAAHYPAGIARLHSDLDLVVPDAGELFGLAGALTAGGWRLRAFRTWLDRAGDQQHFVQLERTDLLDDGSRVDVELRSTWLEGDFWLRGPRATGGYHPRSGRVAVALAVLEEGTTRRFRCRDVVDWRCVMGPATPAEHAEVARLAQRFELLVPLHRLRRLGAGAGLAVSTGVVPHPFRVTELPHWVRGARRPLAWISAFDWWRDRAGRSRPALPALRAVHRLGLVPAAWRAGAPVFLAPLSEDASHPAVDTRVGARAVRVDSTLGTFAGSLGCDLEEEWLTA